MSDAVEAAKAVAMAQETERFSTCLRLRLVTSLSKSAKIKRFMKWHIQVVSPCCVGADSASSSRDHVCIV